MSSVQNVKHFYLLLLQLFFGPIQTKQYSFSAVGMLPRPVVVQLPPSLVNLGRRFSASKIVRLNETYTVS